MNPAIPRTKGGTGTSFKGTAKYLLHDIGKHTSERVLWTETVNLMTDDPQLAWRIMSATAMDADRIKRAYHEARQEQLPEDQRKAYRSSKPGFNHVFHYALTWHPEEAPDLTREVMMREAKASLRVLEADGLQAMVVCHMDTEHPHVHVMVNRVHPQTGKSIAVESNAKNKLSAYALQKDLERGYTYAPQREINAMKREARVPYPGDKDVSRQIFEQRAEVREAIKAAPEKAKAVREKQTALDRALAREEAAMRGRHRKMATALSKAHRQRKAVINQHADDAKAETKTILGEQYATELQRLGEEMRAERRQLAKSEENDLGRLLERLRAVGKSWNVSEAATLRGKVAETFEGFGARGYAEQVLKKDQAKRRSAVGARFRSKLRQHVREISAVRRQSISENYGRYKTEYSALTERLSEDKQAIRNQWRARDTQRKVLWRKFSKSVRFERDFLEAATPAVKSRENQSGQRNVEQLRSKTEEIKRRLQNRDKDRDKS